METNKEQHINQDFEAISHETKEQSLLVKEYSEDGFWEKIKAFAKKAGREVIYNALLLYYVLQEDGVPIWVKTTIYGALGYFISPIDAIPDIAPFIGFTDDLGILVATIAVVSVHINDNVREKANQKIKEWFGE